MLSAGTSLRFSAVHTAVVDRVVIGIDKGNCSERTVRWLHAEHLPLRSDFANASAFHSQLFLAFLCLCHNPSALTVIYPSHHCCIRSYCSSLPVRRSATNSRTLCCSRGTVATVAFSPFFCYQLCLLANESDQHCRSCRLLVSNLSAVPPLSQYPHPTGAHSPQSCSCTPSINSPLPDSTSASPVVSPLRGMCCLASLSASREQRRACGLLVVRRSRDSCSNAGWHDVLDE